MEGKTEEYFEKKMVAAIKNGLFEIKQEMYGNTDRVNNSLPSRKLDKIANSIIKEFEDADVFEEPLWRRGGYDITMLYNKVNKTLYTFMSDKRFEELLKRKSISKLHYLDVLDEFNNNVDSQIGQISIFEEKLKKDNDKLVVLKNNLLNILHSNEPLKYVTICHNTDGFRLCNVHAIITSRNLDIIDDKDLSEFIDIDYSDIIYDDVPKNILDEEVKVTLKNNISNLPNDPDGIEIPVKQNIEKKHK